MKYRWLRGFLIVGMAWFPVPAFAQDGDDDTEEAAIELEAETESAEEEDISGLDALHHQGTVPEDSADYEEISHMRVLERTFIPEDNQAKGTVAGIMLPGNMLGLSHDAVMHMLRDGVSADMPSRGLQRQSSRLMAQASERVRRQLAESKTGLEKPFGLECTEQPAVQEYIAVFSSPAAGTMKTWLKRLGRWQSHLERALIQENVPTDLVYLAMIESGFKTKVRSPASAAGMWQFMAGTGREMGLRIDDWVDERYDPIKSAHAAAQYLKKQYARYHSWPLAMAAYNGGPGTVNVAIDRFNTTDYFKLVKYGAMYDETRKYVPRILAAAIIGKNRAVFGFDGLTAEAPFVFDEAEVPGGTKLSVLAEAAGCSTDALKELNPELLKDKTPPDNSYVLRIPVGSHDRFVASFDKISKKYAVSNNTAAVRFGESIEDLAEDIGVPARVLRTLNHIKSKEEPAYGTELIIPEGSRRGDGKNSDSNKDNHDGDALKIALISGESFSFADRRRIFYETKKDDTIKKIADHFELTPTQIALWNELDVWAKLRPKMMLQLFVSKNAELEDTRYYEEDEVRAVVRGSAQHQELISARNSKSSSAKSTVSTSGHYVVHTVVKGDSLSKIAKKYGVSQSSLIKLNNLKNDGTLRKGQKLKIKKTK